jgi:crotonobetainyl-CoA:carnitine CoA-transferase CaiB-like acyl-CoA transferase
VIKVENTVQRQIIGSAPVRREDGQLVAPSLAQRAAGFSDLNRSKLGITLNLNLPEARDAVKRLVAVSDVVIDNFSPRVMRNFGLEYEDLVKVKEDIIVASMPAFGKTGPFRDRTSFGPGIDALSGLSHLTGYPDSTPLKPGNYYCDYNAGVLAATAIMAAIYSRRRTGKGQFIEIAMRDGETQLVGEYALDYSLNGRIQQRAGNRHPALAPHGIYRCKGEDSWIAIAVRSDREWRALCRVMRRPGLAEDERFATLLARKRNEDEVDKVLSQWTLETEHISAMHELQSAGVPAAAVMTTKEIAEDPQFKHRDAFQAVEFPGGEAIRLQRVGWRALEANPVIRRGPNFSEHTMQVLTGLGGMTREQVEHLAAIGAVVLPEVEEGES